MTTSLCQTYPLPSAPRPIVIIGAGGIVKDAHLPAYAKASLPVAGLFDVDKEKAQSLARSWNLPVFASLADAIATPGGIFDVAVPPTALPALLPHLPKGSVVQLQKPMGLDLAEATKIRALCRERKLTVCVNFQLRFAPMMLAVQDAVRRGSLGRLLDIEVHLNLLTPWHLFPHLKVNPRVEIVSHSIHYLDLIRAVAGTPRGVLARTYGHPSSDLAQTRTSAILDYGSDLRVTMSINHNHGFGRKFQDASIRIEGDAGAAVVKLGLLLNYPNGEPDELWITSRGEPWCQIPLEGKWFPDGFIGIMSNLQRFASGEDTTLHTSVEDAWQTMALVEACYRSDASASMPIPTDGQT